MYFCFYIQSAEQFSDVGGFVFTRQFDTHGHALLNLDEISRGIVYGLSGIGGTAGGADALHPAVEGHTGYGIAGEGDGLALGHMLHL